MLPVAAVMRTECTVPTLPLLPPHLPVLLPDLEASVVLETVTHYLELINQ